MLFKCVLILLFFSCTVKAQTPPTNIKDLIEHLAENLPEDYDLSALEDQLAFFSTHQINLNHTTTDELKQLMFLSPLQIVNLFEHIKVNGKLLDVLELQGIAGFDLQSIQNLLPFVTVGVTEQLDPLNINNLRKLANHELIIRISKTIEEQKGYAELPGSRYLGSPEKFLLKYKYNYGNRLSAALTFEKDAGEKFIRGPKELLLDFQSAHIAINHIGKFKKIILGDYSLQFGQGLTLWSGFAFGKAPDVANIAKKDLGLITYRSANEYSFFRGAATTFSFSKNLDFTTFFSARHLDASLSVNDNNEEVLVTINESGLHRTANEIKHKNNISQKVYGAAFQFQSDRLNIGAVAYHTSFNKAFMTGPQVYRAFNFIGKKLTNVGINYSYAFKNIYFFGELAQSLDGSLAYLNGALLSLSAKVSAAFLHRNYQSNYHSFFNQAVSESDGTNERGFYTGININPTKAWFLSFYADYFKFPWLKFRVDAPSDGHEVSGQATYSPTKTFRIILRYKSEIKQQNTDEEVPISFLEKVKKESYRADVNWQLTKVIKFQNRIEFSQFVKGAKRPEFGYLVYQDVSFNPLLPKLSANFRIAYFNTPSYNSRLYAYEDDVLYNFGFGIYSGNGYRTILNLKYKLFKKLDLWARYALFLYPSVDTVGSGLDEILGNKKSEVKLQLRYQF